MNVKYQFLETLKCDQILKPENFTKSQTLNMLIQTQSQMKLVQWGLKNKKLRRTVVKSLTRTITKKYVTISCNERNKAKSFSKSQCVAEAKKYPGGRDFSKIFLSTFITLVENIYSRV